MLYLHPPGVTSVPGVRSVLSCPHLTIPSPAVSQSIVGGGSGVRCSLGEGGIGMMPHSRLDWILDRDGIQPPPPFSDEIKSLNQTLYPSYIWCLMHKITFSDGRQPQQPVKTSKKLSIPHQSLHSPSSHPPTTPKFVFPNSILNILWLLEFIRLQM